MDKEFLHIKLIREIISRIASGIYEDGKRLPAERKLCDQFSVSRGTIRQALADLEKLGVITVKPGSGAYVRKYSYKNIPGHILPPEFSNVTLKDIITARKAIEMAAIDTACEKISETQLSELEKKLQIMSEHMDNLPEFLRIDMDFHQAVVRSSGNVVLATAFEAISEYHKYSQVFTSIHAGEEQKAHNYHRKILDALRARDKKKAKKTLENHLDYMKKMVSDSNINL